MSLLNLCLEPRNFSKDNSHCAFLLTALRRCLPSLLIYIISQVKVQRDLFHLSLLLGKDGNLD